MKSKVEEEKLERDDLSKYPLTDIKVPLITRDKWYGLPPQLVHVEPMKSPHRQICFVPTESSPCETTEDCVIAVAELQKRNMILKNWPDMPFNFLIGGDGYVYEGRGWLMKYKDFGNSAMHETLQIGYIGHYKDRDPPKEMVNLGALLIEYGKQRKYISPDYKYMECPLTEYYQYPPDLQSLFESKGYKDFLATVPAAPPPRPTNKT